MRTLLLLLCLLLPNTIFAGPFGTYMGEPVSDFKDLVIDDQPDPKIAVYRTHILPKTNSVFEAYLLCFWEDGLSKIAAFGKENEHDGYGATSKNQYNKLREELTKKYGKPSEIVEIGPKKSAVLGRDEFFVVSLYEKKRMHLSYWNKNLPDDLESIVLEIKADVGHQSHVELTYEFKNFKNAVETMQNKDSDAL